jgi:Ricin-type beta-trefoil lectin domain-like
MKIRLFHLMCTFALATAVTRPMTAQIYSTIKNPPSGKCLQPVDGSTLAGTAIVLKTCTTDPIQQWSVVPAKTIYIHFVNRLTGMCLDARGGAENNTPIQQWPCNQISNEYWEPEFASYRIYTPSLISGVANSSPRYCLNLPFDLTNDGTTLQIYDCNATAAQQWTWVGASQAGEAEGKARRIGLAP